MTDWALTDRDGLKILSFRASQRVPEQLAGYAEELAMREHYAQTFQDLCFYAGNESVPEGYQVDTITKQREGTLLADLGWILPSRFVDAVIDALGKVNDSMLAGNMDNAILYGVVTKS